MGGEFWPMYDLQGNAVVLLESVLQLRDERRL
jgi:hypothetical protein